MAAKDLRLLARDPMGLFFALVFPVLFGVFFGLIYAKFGSDDGAMRVGIVDEDQSVMSRRFVEVFNETEGLETIPMEIDRAETAVRKGDVVGYLQLPAGFGEHAGIIWEQTPTIVLEVDPSRKAEAGFLQGHIMRGMVTLIEERMSDRKEMRSRIQTAIAQVRDADDMSAPNKLVLGGFLAAVDQFLAAAGDGLFTGDGFFTGDRRLEPVRIESRRPAKNSAQSEHQSVYSLIESPFEISFPAAMMWGVMGCVAGFASSIVRERTEGTYLRLQSAPIGRTQVLAGKAAACFIAVAGVMLFMNALGVALGVPVRDPLGLAVAVACASWGFVGIMMCMSVLGNTERAVDSAAWAIIVVACMFGGAMIPLAFMPKWMQTASNFSPVKWGILAFEGASWRKFSMTELAKPCGVLLAIGTACFAAGAKLLARQDSRA
jgi:ABC-2 type transport system permease protein